MLAQKLGQLQLFLAVFEQECVGQLGFLGQPNTFLAPAPDPRAPPKPGGLEGVCDRPPWARREVCFVLPCVWTYRDSSLEKDWRFPFKLSKSGPDKSKRIVVF